MNFRQSDNTHFTRNYNDSSNLRKENYIHYKNKFLDDDNRKYTYNL